jgi:GTP-binding protein
MSVYPHIEFITSANRSSQFVADQGKEVAFAGRSNAGKSSAINTITARRGLAPASKTPGRTQLLNLIEIEPGQRLVDLPRYGFAKVPEAMRRHWRALMEAYFEGRESLAGLFVVMDCRRPLRDFDLQMLSWAEYKRCPAHVLLTKADKLSRGKASAALHATRRELADNITVQLFSALKHTGVDEARAQLDEMLATPTDQG